MSSADLEADLARAVVEAEERRLERGMEARLRLEAVGVRLPGSALVAGWAANA